MEKPFFCALYPRVTLTCCSDYFLLCHIWHNKQQLYHNLILCVNICMRNLHSHITTRSCRYSYNSKLLGFKNLKFHAEIQPCMFNLIFRNFIPLMLESSRELLYATVNWCDNMKKYLGVHANLNQQKQNIPRPFFGFIGIIFSFSQQICSALRGERKNCFLIEWLNLPELGLKIVYTSNMFHKMKANREIFGCHGKKFELYC